MKPSVELISALMLACSMASTANAQPRGIAQEGLNEWTVHPCPTEVSIPCIVPIFAWADEDEVEGSDERKSVWCYLSMPHVIDIRANQKLIFVIGPTSFDFSFDEVGVEFVDGKDQEDEGKTERRAKKHTKVLKKPNVNGASYITYNVRLTYPGKEGKPRNCRPHGPTIVNRG